jgi:hypothetical protein
MIAGVVMASTGFSGLAMAINMPASTLLWRGCSWGVADEVLMRHVVEAGADGMTVNFLDRLLA